MVVWVFKPSTCMREGYSSCFVCVSVTMLAAIYLIYLLQCFLHLTTGLICDHACARAEQLKSPLFNFFKKLPIIQKLFPNIWPRSI